MIGDFMNKNRNSIGEANRATHLVGKAVLLVGNDTAVLQNLVTRLAKRGADIALVCWQMPLEIARKMKEYVQSFGQKLLVIERVENQTFSIEQLVHKVVTEMGHFDIFIDVSTRIRPSAQDETSEAENEPQVDWLPPKWQLTPAILGEIAR